MSPLDLDDVERYLLKQNNDLFLSMGCVSLDSWIRDRFHELREREKAVQYKGG